MSKYPKKVFIVHGFTSSPNAGWIPYIMQELKDKNIYSHSIFMPNSEEPVLEEWVNQIKNVINFCKNDTIYLVGHSLGCAAILKFLENTNVLMGGVFLVGGRIIKSENKLTENFYKEDFDFDSIKNNSNKFVIIHGEKDDVVDVSNAYELAAKLNTEPCVVQNGNHFTGSTGYKTFPLLLEKILEVIKY
jgi:hypothetical protein